MEKPFIVQYLVPLSLTMLIVGAVMVVVGILDLTGNGFQGMGNWGYWIAGIGCFVLVIGFAWHLSYRLHARKFRKLMGEKSKAVFVKQIDDIDYLLERLPMMYDDELMSKKKELGIK